MGKKDITDVSVVVCTRNNKDNIRNVIQRLIDEDPGELIVVDGKSTDGTREILDDMGVTVLNDPGKGLALARQIALDSVKGQYVLYVGDDNIIPKGGIFRLKKYLIDHDWIGAAFQTRIQNAKNDYWTYCANIRWMTRFYEGERAVIGTPYMFKTDLLKKAGYDEKCTVSDDSDMEKRLSKITRKKYGYSNVVCYEIGKTGLHETIVRFMMYGKSDAEFWEKYSDKWRMRRKLKSIFHPIEDELIRPMERINSFTTKIYVFPYFFFVALIRYAGWVRETTKNRKKDRIR